jgi:hypothetical protein
MLLLSYLGYNVKVAGGMGTRRVLGKKRLDKSPKVPYIYNKSRLG